MSFPTSFSPFISRLISVLIEGAGNDGRTIDAGHFGWGPINPETPDEMMGIAALWKPQIDVSEIRYEDTGAISENMGFAQYRIEIDLLIAYRVESEVWREKRTELMDRILSDAHMIRAALGNPGNLPQSITGLASGMLRLISSGPAQYNREAGIAKNSMTFRGIIHIAFPD